MMTTNENAYAKLNISLDVTERREDGYHDMLMVMQTVSLCDEVTVTLDGSGRVRARSNLRFIPGDERNLAVKAALCFLEETGHTGQGMLIEINKRIPVGAGMGGGSSDAAAVLRCARPRAAALPERAHRLGRALLRLWRHGAGLRARREARGAPGYAGLPLHYMQARIFYIHA